MASAGFTHQLITIQRKGLELFKSSASFDSLTAVSLLVHINQVGLTNFKSFGGVMTIP